MAFNLFQTPKLAKPIQAYDPTKSVQQNMDGQGWPDAQNIVAAYRTPQAQLQMQQGQVRQQATKPQPVIDPNSSTSGMDAVIANMYTSPEQEEKMRKASVAKQRILAIGDALRHIGNIYNTVNYAPSQQFNKPWEEEQTRYEKGKAVRDAANAHYLSYQQAKAKQDAAIRQHESEMNYKNAMLRHYQDQDRRLWFTANANATNQQALRSLQQQKLELDRAFKEGKIEIDKYNAESRRIGAQAAALRTGSGGGHGGDNLEGRVVKEERTYTPDGKTETITKKWTNTRTGKSGQSTKTKRKSRTTL